MAERRKLEAGMFVFAVFSGLLMVPPLVHVFHQKISHFGIPQIVFYLFAVWVLMIVGTALLTRLLPRDAGPDDAGEGGT